VRAVTVPPAVVRRAIARCWLGESSGETLGGIVLRPHQRRALARLRRALDRDGGALLADAVGMGKTYVALALARAARDPLVVAPAALRATWRDAAARCGVSIRFVSFETLSRRAARDDDGPRADLLVVDEAHHARNRGTRRWRRLAALAAGARVLLLSATPVHNASRELRALLALFLGERADRLDGAALLRLVVRRRQRDLHADPCDDGSAPLPAIVRARWRALPRDPGIGRALRAIPAPLATAGGATGGALWRMGLVRAWGSSDAALRAALRRRLAVATALESALDAGRLPSRRELRAWTADQDAVQLAFPEVVADTEAGAAAGAWRDLAGAHATGVRAALDALGTRPDRDRRRAAWLRAIRHRHDRASVVAFTHSAETARALYRRLAPDGGVALLTAAGGRVAGGPLARADLLARFAPHAAGVPPPPSAERITLLVATDCLSEGLDLRDASVVVHLDVPWTPARLVQRVGRAARLGAPHDAVHVHGLAPPLGVARWLALGRRLRAKAAAARRAVGGGARDGRGTAPSEAELAVRLARRLERWAAAPVDQRAVAPGPPDGPLVALVPGRRAGFLAACVDARGPLLVAADGRRLSDAPAALLRALRRVDRAAPVSCVACAVDDALAAAWRRVVRWHRAARAHQGAGLTEVESAGALATRALARIDAVVGRVPPHRRPACAATAARLRATLRRPLGAAIETAIAESLGGAANERWLEAMAGLLASVARAPEARDGPDAPGTELRLVAIVLVGAASRTFQTFADCAQSDHTSTRSRFP